MHKENVVKSLTPNNPQGTIQERDRQYVWHQWSPLKMDLSQLTLIRGDGYRVWDFNGKEYIDASSMNLSCGYGRKEIVEAIEKQLQKFHSTDISVASHEPVGLLAERLAQSLPRELSKTLFVNSGSEGIEAAIYIAKSYWSQIDKPRSRFVSFARGYHGTTLMCRNLSKLREVTHLFSQPFPVTHVELPMPPRDLRHPDSLKSLLEAFEKAIMDDTNNLPAAVIIEPFINVGGGIVLPRGFLHELHRICKEANVLLIIDEVFTAYGRSGKMFGFQHENVVPDILVSSKGLSGGYMPITAVTVQEFIHKTFAKDPVFGGLRYGHTNSGHAASCVAALATLDILDREKLSDRAAANGRILYERFAHYTDLENIIDVRSYGLVLAFEMNSSKKASILKTIGESLGLLMRQNNEVIMIVPPLIIDKQGIDAISERLSSCLKRLISS